MDITNKSLDEEQKLSVRIESRIISDPETRKITLFEKNVTDLKEALATATKIATEADTNLISLSITLKAIGTVLEQDQVKENSNGIEAGSKFSQVAEDLREHLDINKNVDLNGASVLESHEDGNL